MHTFIDLSSMCLYWQHWRWWSSLNNYREIFQILKRVSYSEFTTKLLRNVLLRARREKKNATIALAMWCHNYRHFSITYRWNYGISTSYLKELIKRYNLGFLADNTFNIEGTVSPTICAVSCRQQKEKEGPQLWSNVGLWFTTSNWLNTPKRKLNTYVGM